jgi:uncharacterized protein
MRRLLLVAFLLFIGFAQAAEIAFPPLTGRVVDQANILSASVERELTAKLEGHERTTSQQVVVATVAALDGQAIEEYGYQLGRAWGIGEKGKNTGVILVVAPNDRQVRIEVGYGLEGQLTDALSRLIIENEILPRFRNGQIEAGVVAGVDAMLPILRGEPSAVPRTLPPAPSRDPGEIPLFVILIIFFVIARFRGRRRRGLWPLILGTGILNSGSRGRRNDGFGGGFGGGRSGGGGFRGGGGSFGGGGASGRW